jgi:hypothetical protein
LSISRHLKCIETTDMKKHHRWLSISKNLKCIETTNDYKK